MSLAHVGAQIEADQRAHVMFQVWGHLYPEPGNRYKGRIVFVVSGYGGNCCILHSEWQGLEDSPLLFETMQDVFDDSRIRSRGKDGLRGSCRHDVFEWTGELICYKNGNTRLTKGKVRTAFRVR